MAHAGEDSSLRAVLWVWSRRARGRTDSALLERQAFFPRDGQAPGGALERRELRSRGLVV